MDTVISLAITTQLLLGAGYVAKKLLSVVQKTVVEHITKGLSAADGGGRFLVVRSMSHCFRAWRGEIR